MVRSDSYLTADIEQQRVLWLERLRFPEDSEDIAISVRAVFAHPAPNDRALIASLELATATAVALTHSAEAVLDEVELAVVMGGARYDDGLRVLLERIMRTCLDIALSPFESDLLDDAKAMLGRLHTLLNDAHVAEATKAVRSMLSGLSQIVAQVSAGPDASGSVSAFLSVEKLVKELQPPSRCNWHLGLNAAFRSDHSCTIDERAKVAKASCPARLSEVLQAKAIPPGMRIAMDFLAFTMRAEGLLEQQFVLNLRESFLRHGDHDLSQLHVEDPEVANWLDVVADCVEEASRFTEAEIEGDYATMVYGSALLASRLELSLARSAANRRAFVEAAKHQKAALDLACTARRAAERATDAEGVALAACAAAHAVQLAGDRDEFAKLRADAIAAARRAGKDLERSIVNQLENCETNTVGVSKSRPPLSEGDIQLLSDRILEAWKLPDDRRPHVERDIREHEKAHHENRVYCRHLSPLQDLRHTADASTCYASPVEYTIRCELLQYESRIGTQDMDTALLSFKANYCEQCDKRAPFESID